MNIRQLQKIEDLFDWEAHALLLKTDITAHFLKKQGYLKKKGHIVHCDSIKEVRSRGGALQGWALIGGVVLGLLVGRLLFGQGGKTPMKTRHKPLFCFSPFLALVS